MSAEVHIAGLDIQVGNFLRQRCGWCGTVLEDYDMSRMSRALQPGEDPDAPWKPATWPVGGLVEVDGNFSTVVPHEDGAILPPHCCAQVDPAVTA